MTQHKPLSDEWLSWDPQTIHAYPETPDVEDAEYAALGLVAENPGPNRLLNDHSARMLAKGLLHDLAAGIISGLVAAILLACVVLLFPGVSRAAEPDSAVGYSLGDRESGHPRCWLKNSSVRVRASSALSG